MIHSLFSQTPRPIPPLKAVVGSGTVTTHSSFVIKRWGIEKLPVEQLLRHHPVVKEIQSHASMIATRDEEGFFLLAENILERAVVNVNLDLRDPYGKNQ